MDDLTVLYFACLRDVELLKISLSSLPVGLSVVLAVDEAEREEFEKLGLAQAMGPSPRVESTEFPRGYSLNQSPDCVIGMLEYYDRLGTNVLKVDCDTACLHFPKLLLASDYDHIGQKGTTTFDGEGMRLDQYDYIKGHAYFLSRRMIQRIIENAEGLLSAADAFARGKLSHPAQVLNWPEDGTISIIVQMLQPEPGRIAMCPEGPLEWCTHYNWRTGEHNPLAHFVNCGDEPGKDRARTAKVMAGLVSDFVSTI